MPDNILEYKLLLNWMTFLVGVFLNGKHVWWSLYFTQNE